MAKISWGIHICKLATMTVTWWRNKKALNEVCILICLHTAYVIAIDLPQDVRWRRLLVARVMSMSACLWTRLRFQPPNLQSRKFQFRADQRAWILVLDSTCLPHFLQQFRCFLHSRCFRSLSWQESDKYVVMYIRNNKKPTNWLGQTKRHATKIWHQVVIGGIFSRFSNLEKWRLEVADKVIPGGAIDYADMDARVKFGDSMINNDQIIRLVVGQTRFTQFCAVFNCILQPTGSS